MTGRRITTVLGQLGLTQVRYVSPVRLGAARGPVGRIYRQAEADFGVLAPPVALHSPAPDVLAAAWVMLRETLLVPGSVGRAAKEAVATAVSRSNTCPFCVTVHGRTLDDLVGPGSADPAVLAARDWARAAVTERTAVAHQPPCPAPDAPELIGTAVLLHYLNRMVNVFLTEVPLPPGVPRLALGRVMGVLSGMIRSAAAGQPRPGASLELLPAAEPPGDIGWASGNSVVAPAFARACAAVDRAGDRSVPSAVREVVLAELAGWRGEHRGPSRAWAEEAVRTLPVADRPAGRLALLTALGSHQVDKPVIEGFRRDRPGDEALIELTAWAALAAARRAARWIPVGTRSVTPEWPN